MPRPEERRLVDGLKPGLRVHDDDALNAETHPHELDQPITPIASFFVRNNGLLPDVDAERWTLAVDGEVERPLSLSLDDLMRSFERVSATAVLECAGNGRSGFREPTEGLPWGHGAVGCAQWSGVRLADVLRAAGVRRSAVYTGHFSPDVQTDGSGKRALSRGLPIEKALAQETLLAFEMNGEPLPYVHGGPLRIVAPGFPGSAWQKWLARIWVRDREHDGEKMTGTEYRMPTVPVAPGGAIDERAFEVITDIPVKSLITWPAEDFVLAGSEIAIRGFAWSGRVPVASVAVSLDDGATWQAAELEPAVDRFAWRRFRARVRPARAGRVRLLSRATDEAGGSQPLQGARWNPRGYCNNAVYRVNGTIDRGAE
jgi:DMSO/TMAO reductase YedYZ molybdopterin-dependent catalytic subunit